MNPDPSTATKWLPVMSIMQLKPGTVVRERGPLQKVLPPQVIDRRTARLVRFSDRTETTVTAAKLFLEFRAA